MCPVFQLNIGFHRFQSLNSEVQSPAFQCAQSKLYHNYVELKQPLPTAFIICFKISFDMNALLEFLFIYIIFNLGHSFFFSPAVVGNFTSP